MYRSNTYYQPRRHGLELYIKNPMTFEDAKLQLSRGIIKPFERHLCLKMWNYALRRRDEICAALEELDQRLNNQQVIVYHMLPIIVSKEEMKAIDWAMHHCLDVIPGFPCVIFSNPTWEKYLSM